MNSKVTISFTGNANLKPSVTTFTDTVRNPSRLRAIQYAEAVVKNGAWIGNTLIPPFRIASVEISGG